MTDDEIDFLRAIITNIQGTDETLIWRDVDGGIHEVVGFNPRFKEHPEDHLSEPVFILRPSGCVAVSNTSRDCFHLMKPVFVNAPDHENKGKVMKTTTTQRGFAIGTFTDANGVECSIQKSSLATDDCIWLGANDIGLKLFEAYKGWKDVDTTFTMERHYSANTRMHLNRDQVKELLPLLQHFADTGELP